MDGWAALGELHGVLDGAILVAGEGDVLIRVVFWPCSWVLLGAGSRAPLSTPGSPGICTPRFHQTPSRQKKVQRTRGCWGACSPLQTAKGPSLQQSSQGQQLTEGPLAPEHVSVSSSLCFTPGFCSWCSRGATRLCLGLATAACNCSSSQTSVSLPQGWGWGCLGNAAGVVCLVVCSRNVGQTVKFFSPLVK